MDALMVPVFRVLSLQSRSWGKLEDLPLLHLPLLCLLCWHLDQTPEPVEPHQLFPVEHTEWPVGA